MNIVWEPAAAQIIGQIAPSQIAAGTAAINISGNAATASLATALSNQSPQQCSSGQVASGVTNTGNAVCTTVTAATLTGILPIANGGTAANSAATALTNLGAASSLGLSGEISRAEGAEGTLSTSISTEAAARQAGDAATLSSAKQYSDTTNVNILNNNQTFAGNDSYSGTATFTGSKVDLSQAGATLPAQVVATQPSGACTVVNAIQLWSQGPAGQQLYICRQDPSTQAIAWAAVNDEAALTQRLTSDNSNLQNEINSANAAISSETSRAEGAESTLNAGIGATGAAISNEVSRATQAEQGILNNAQTFAGNESFSGNNNFSGTASFTGSKVDLSTAGTTLPARVDASATMGGACTVANAMVLNPSATVGQQLMLCQMVNSQLQWVLVNDEQALSQQLQQADSNLQSAVTAETNRAEGAEQTLTTNLNSEINRAQGAESTVSSSLSAEVSRAKGTEATLGSSITAETIRAQAAESTLASSIVNESSRAETAEAGLQSNINSVSAASAQLSGNNVFTGNNTFKGTTFDVSGVATTLPVRVDTSAAVNAACATQNAMALNPNQPVGQQLMLCQMVNSQLQWVLVNDEQALTQQLTTADNTLTTNLNNEISRAEGAESNLSTAISNEALARSQADAATLSSANQYTDTAKSSVLNQKQTFAGNESFSGNNSYSGSNTFTGAVTLSSPVINQAQNGVDLVFGKRATDSSPTGNLLHFQNQAGNQDLFTVDASGDVVASNISGNKFTGDGSGLSNVQASAISGSATINETQVTNLINDLASKLSANSALNASNLSSGTVPSGALSGTYNINISGNAATATSAASAASVAASGVTGVLSVGNGGTGSAAQNFVDLTTGQSVAGNKTFTGTMTLGDLVLNQSSNNTDALSGKRATDSSPTGNLMHFANAAGASDLWTVDVNGTLQAGSVPSARITGELTANSVPWAGVTGTPTTLSGYGITNGVSTSGSYADPSWITSLSGSKIVGNITGSAASITGSITESQVMNLTNDLGSKLTASSALNASNLTSGTVPAGALSGSYNISVTGNAATATSATTAASASSVPASGVSGVLPITNGGTGLSGGTSGGILGFTAGGALASSALLSSGGLILGGGAGATPSTSPNFITTSGANSAVLNVGASGTGSANSGNLGALFLAGSTSGGPTLASQAAGGSLILQLPSTAPSANQVLTATAVNSGTVTLGFSTPAGGTVSSIATNGPITGGTITSTGTIACPTCVIGTGLTSGQLIAGGGSQAVALANLTGDVSTNGGTVTTLAANVGGAHTFSGNITFSNPISGSISGSAANFTGNLSGDVTGTQSSSSVAKINGSPLGTTTGASTGQVLAWSGTNWGPANVTGTGFAPQGPNTVFAGPSTGTATNPAFRALAAADLPPASTTAQGAVKPTIVITSTTSAAKASAGTTATAVASCASGRIVIGGGAQATTSDTSHSSAVYESYPNSTTAWTATGVVTTNLGNGVTMTVTAYAICSGS